MSKNNKIKKSAWIGEVLFNKRFYALLGILIFIALVKMLITSQFDLDSEEAQYWLWSKHLQLSYYSKPPLIAYLNWFSTSIFGDTVFAIRLNAVIIGFLVSLVSYLLAYELFKNIETARLTALVTNLFPFLLHSSIIFTTDSLLLFFWICGMLTFWKAAQTNRWEWWILFGASIGFGALSKYTILLIFFPLVLYAWKFHGEIFRSARFYLSILLGLLIFSPVIYWNIQQNGLGFLHLVYLSGIYGPKNSPSNIILNILTFTAGQLILLLPFYQYPKIIRKFRQRSFSRQEVYLLLPALFIFLLFSLVAIIRHGGAYLNWAMFAYSGIPILFSHFVVSEKSWNLNRRVLGLMAATFLLFIGLSLPYNKILPLGKSNPANKLIGWSQLAKKIDSLRVSYSPERCYVFSTNYHITSALSFYMEGQPQAFYLNLNSRMTQYDLWKGTEQFINTGKTAIWVDSGRMPAKIKASYTTILKEDSCIVYSQNHPIKTYYITLLQGLKDFQNHPASY